MWEIRGKSKYSILLLFGIYAFAATLVFGCENRTFYDANRDKNINLVPTQMENPNNPVPDLPDAKAPPDITVDVAPDIVSETTAIPTPTVSDTPVSITPEKPADTDEEDEVIIPAIKPAGRFIQTAFWVMQHEGKKIGTACNRFVSRVLVLNGFSDDGFLANDFDVYANTHFSEFRSETFLSRNFETERIRLKRHLWSSPQRTPFILQWERPGRHGHIAILERIDDQLVIYQANLGRHLARREETTVERLLNPQRGPHLRVYSQFKPR